MFEEAPVEFTVWLIFRQVSLTRGEGREEEEDGRARSLFRAKSELVFQGSPKMEKLTLLSALVLSTGRRRNPAQVRPHSDQILSSSIKRRKESSS